MATASITFPPRRITDLVDARKAGANVTLTTYFDILPVDFHHRSNPFHAYIFLTRFAGTIDDKPFEFRKCYARGCPNNLCTHVSQAVNIANRYLQRDYHALKSAGLQINEILFSLANMIVKFELLKETGLPALTIQELTGIARAGNKLTVAIELDFIPAVEYFASQKNAQTFLSGEFTAKAEDQTYLCHRCFACYPTDQEAREKETAVKLANARLKLIYDEFDKVGIAYKKQLFACHNAA